VTPKFTAKQRAFVLEYPKDFNATQAALRAGYSAKTAFAIGSENLRKPLIKAAVEEEFKRRALSLDEILARLEEQATASIANFLVINPDGDRIAFDPEFVQQSGHLIKNIKAKTTVKYSEKGDQFEYTSLEITLHDAQRALELLGKHHQAFTDRLELSGKIEHEHRYLTDSEVVREFAALAAQGKAGQTS
jgi:phage terminase small subunit